jgi:anti-sigma factor RsiW
MMHTQIEQEEIIERYARKQLTPEEQRAFEAHFFGCEECFQKLQEMERFLAGVRDAGERGLLNERAQAAAAGRIRWLLPALAAATCAVLFGAASGWMYFHEIPRLRGELEQATKQLNTEKQQRAEREQKPAVVETAEANVPLVMLQTSRSGEGAATVVIPKEARRVVLWIEIGPSRYREFQLQVFSSQGQLVSSLQHLKPGPYGALAASLPTEQLPRGECRIKLTGLDPAPAALAGEYLLRINRP